MRIWKQAQDLSNSVHCLSNGDICIYEKGPEILQIFGPPFGCGTVAGLSIAGEGYSAESERVRRTNTWKHTLFRREKKNRHDNRFRVSRAKRICAGDGFDRRDGMENRFGAERRLCGRRCRHSPEGLRYLHGISQPEGYRNRIFRG